ncbi:MAG: hypothetical protein EA377_11015 [Phycisphaerales bacterium]|nr:MAG: hypothetical protein EA377_11015 [Phycisphaerales bacterium]
MDGWWAISIGTFTCAPAGLTCDGVVDTEDLFMLLAAWGECADPGECPADFDGNGVVDVDDLFILLVNWG